MNIQLTVFLFFIFSNLLSQDLHTAYEPNMQYPYGAKNPLAPEQLKDFEPLIGICDCASESRNADGSWQTPVSMTWKFKYIMNGMAIQDETLKADGKHSGSIRQFDKDSLQWYVHYYSSSAVVPTLSSWKGGKKEDGSIVLYKAQKSPDGKDGFYRLTFYDIRKSGYMWKGEWVSVDESVVYPTWKIQCIKRKEQ